MNEQKIRFVIPEKAEPERIDKFLVSHLHQFSRNRIQKLIDENQVLVNGRSVKASFPVAPHQSVEITLPPPRETEILPENIPLNIIHEDESLLVVDKPAGMVVHPAFGHTGATLVNALLHHCTDLSGINGELRPGIVHRLDKDTSGLLVIAKNDFTHRKLAAQFSTRSIHRSYIALLWGNLKQKEGRIETFYGRSPKNRKKMAVLRAGKIAVTHYKVVEEWPFLTMVELRLETGRTHQIRVHMSYLGHPVFADSLYGGKNKRLSSLGSQQRSTAALFLKHLERQALHAKTLTFEHPANSENISFTSPIPEDIEALLSTVRQSR